MEKKKRVLYVDDEVMNRTVFKYAFINEFEIVLADSGAAGLEILGNEHIDLIVSDQIMPNMSGIEFLEKAYKINPHRKHILLTGHTDFANIIDAINKAKVFYFVDKPFDVDKLRSYLYEGLKLYSEIAKAS